MHDTTTVTMRNDHLRTEKSRRPNDSIALTNISIKLLLSISLFISTNVVAGGDSESRLNNLPPLPPGTKIDMSSPYFRDWPQGAPALFRIRRDLVLAVPPQYQRFWYQGDKVVRLPAPVSAIPKRQRPGVSFQFFLPDFMGYAPQNYTSMFDPHEVNVVELQPADPRDIEPGAVGEYPPNMRKRSLSRLLDTHTAQIMYGLTCYQFARQAPETDNEFMCFGRDAKAGNNYVMLDVSLPPYERWVKFPLMQARYFTPRYGGLRIVWRTEARNFPKWQEIDAQVWKFVKEWSVIPNRTTDAKSR